MILAARAIQVMADSDIARSTNKLGVRLSLCGALSRLCRTVPALGSPGIYSLLQENEICPAHLPDKNAISIADSF